MNMRWRSKSLPDYPGFGRGIFIQSLIDLATIGAWLLFGVMFVLAIAAPFIWAFLVALGIIQ